MESTDLREEAPLPAINRCPRCRKEMERGYVYTPSTAFRTVRWSTERKMDMMEFKGETIIPTDNWGSIKIAGFRCPECRIVVFEY